MRDARREPPDAFQLLRLGELVFQAALVGDVEHHAAQHLVLSGALALLTARHPAQVDALLVGGEHAGLEFERARGTLIDAGTHLAVAIARHQPVEEADLLPQVFAETQALRPLRPDVFEMSVFDVERERNGLRAFDHETVLLAAALQLRVRSDTSLSRRCFSVRSICRRSSNSRTTSDIITLNACASASRMANSNTTAVVIAGNCAARKRAEAI